MSIARPIAHLVRGTPTSDGDGVRLTRLLGTAQAPMLDPFLLLDHFDHPDGPEGGGFPDHPHRGFETVTYMLEGQMRHGDNKGHAGVIGPGGVQWMRAGAGLVHSEMPERVAGRMRGFQLWVNLPGRLKMTRPDYQEFPAEAMPLEVREGARIKVLAGRSEGGADGPVRNEAVAPVYFDIELAPGANLEEPLPAELNALVAVYEGEAEIAGARAPALSAALLGPGTCVRVSNGGSTALRFLLIGGRPIGEPVAWAGPFVMNSRAELEQTFADFRAGRF